MGGGVMIRGYNISRDKVLKIQMVVCVYDSYGGRVDTYILIIGFRKRRRSKSPVTKKD